MWKNHLGSSQSQSQYLLPRRLVPCFWITKSSMIASDCSKMLKQKFNHTFIFTTSGEILFWCSSLPLSIEQWSMNGTYYCMQLNKRWPCKTTPKNGEKENYGNLIHSTNNYNPVHKTQHLFVCSTLSAVYQ